MIGSIKSTGTALSEHRLSKLTFVNELDSPEIDDVLLLGKVEQFIVWGAQMVAIRRSH